MRALLLFAMLAMLAVSPLYAVELPAIAYHDIVDAPNGDAYAITVADFERQMAYLARSGYTPISLRLLDDIRAGRRPPPPKPVLLTFDDGLRSYYTRAYPVLERHGFPSVLSVVTAWVDGRSVPEGYRTSFLQWDELRTLVRSPLVEVISHSDDLHRGLPGNPWDSLVPAAMARIYRPDTQRYETEAQHRERVREDLSRSVARLREELGIVPRGIAWPYGQYDKVMLEEAADLGMAYHLTLGIEPNRIDSLPQINRVTFRHYRGIHDLGDALTAKAYRRQQLRFVQIDLDVFGRKERAEQEALVGRLLERLQLLRPNTVIVRPFTADRRAFFPNPEMPVEADLLGYVAHQILSRTGVSDLFLRLPAGTEAMPARFFADLGRYNRFSGVVLEAGDAEVLAGVRAALGPYKPNLKLAVLSATPIAGADYLLAEIGPEAGSDAVARLAKERMAAGGTTLFLLNATGDGSEDTLRLQMRALRASGARHYGYGPDDFLGRLPDARQLAVPLAEHTIAAAER
jgi:biofilm PGA synthesis lipoprotein PgaB